MPVGVSISIEETSSEGFVQGGCGTMQTAVIHRAISARHFPPPQPERLVLNQEEAVGEKRECESVSLDTSRL